MPEAYFYEYFIMIDIGLCVHFRINSQDYYINSRWGPVCNTKKVAISLWEGIPESVQSLPLDFDNFNKYSKE